MKKKNVICITINSIIIAAIVIFYMFDTGKPFLCLALYCAISNVGIAIKDYKGNQIINQKDNNAEKD